MKAPQISDHALLRFLERAGGLPVEALRLELSASLTRATRAAASLGLTGYSIAADGLTYIIRDGVCVTVLPHDETSARQRAGLRSGR